MRKGFELLKPNHAGAFVLKNGQTINYGVIHVVENESVTYYTGKGLRELWSPDLTEGQKFQAQELKNKPPNELMAEGYVKVTPLSEIERVLF